MQRESGSWRVGRFLPLALLVTAIVSILPVVLVAAVDPFRRLDPYLSVPIGIVLSVLLANAGTFIWVRFGSSDVVFSDLLLWGWARRMWVERKLARATARLELLGDDRDASTGDLTTQERTSLFEALVASLEARDAYTHGHSRRVTKHSYMIARALALPPHEVERIRLAASVHDVGKLGLPESIVRKPGRLTDEEYEIVKQHPANGAGLVAAIGDPELASIIRHHHERIDGTGYPDRLRGEEIPLGARIIAVADTFDAITSNRSYRKASSHRRAIAILKKEAGVQLDDDVVKAFLHYYSGRSSVEWWAIVTTVPQRMWATVMGWSSSAAGAVTQGAAATGAAVLVTAGVGTALGPVPGTVVDESRPHSPATAEVKKHRARSISTLASQEIGPTSGSTGGTATSGRATRGAKATKKNATATAIKGGRGKSGAAAGATDATTDKRAKKKTTSATGGSEPTVAAATAALADAGANGASAPAVPALGDPSVPETGPPAAAQLGSAAGGDKTGDG